MKVFITIFFCFLVAANSIVTAQKRNIESNSYFSTGFKQIKESANFGLVFSGPALHYGHSLAFLNNNRIILLENEAGASIPFSKGIPALSIYLKPAEVSWLFTNKKINKHFSAGPMLKLEYDYTLYPQLQSAFDYWFTNFSMGLNSSYGIPFANHTLIARLKFSLIGFTSRQPAYRNPYWYNIGFLHAIRHLNSGLNFSMPDKFNTTNFELTWEPRSGSRFLWTYCFSYSGYYNDPSLSIMKHSIRLTRNKKKIQMNDATQKPMNKHS